MEVGGGGSVDDAQAHPAVALDLHQLGVGKRAVVGEIGVELDVVEVGPAMHRMLVRGLWLPMSRATVRGGSMPRGTLRCRAMRGMRAP
jgi:hypothetical protein